MIRGGQQQRDSFAPTSLLHQSAVRPYTWCIPATAIVLPIYTRPEVAQITSTPTLCPRWIRTGCHSYTTKTGITTSSLNRTPTHMTLPPSLRRTSHSWTRICLCHTQVHHSHTHKHTILRNQLASKRLLLRANAFDRRAVYAIHSSWYYSLCRCAPIFAEHVKDTHSSTYSWPVLSAYRLTLCILGSTEVALTSTKTQIK